MKCDGDGGEGKDGTDANEREMTPMSGLWGQLLLGLGEGAYKHALVLRASWRWTHIYKRGKTITVIN